MSATLALILIAALTCVALLMEAWLYRSRLRRIPIRIHVNGTRGKSSVTRLICAGLNAGGIRSCAKTTGTLARMILSDGSEYPIFRPCRANVIEQKRVIRASVEHSAEALVIECMALQPLLQSVCELKLVQSTHGVITNARADHLDVMGPTRLDVARALAGTTPVGGKLFTAEHRDDSLQVLAGAADDRKSEFESISEFERHRVTPEMLARFSYLEHAENVALALRVCESVGVDREAALRGMWAATPDPGAMRVHHLLRGHRQFHFVNAFAANDPESTSGIWESAYDRFPGVTRRVTVMNCRADRPDRSRTMAAACAAWRLPDLFVVTGTGTEAFVRSLVGSGVDRQQIVCVGMASGEQTVGAITERTEGNAMVLGIGNVAGPGMALAEYFAQVESHASTDPWSVADSRADADRLSPLTKAA